MTDFQQFAPPSGTSEPGRDVTAVMGRRIAAWIVDLIIFIGLSVAMFAVQAEYVDLSNSNAAFGDACALLQDDYGDLASGCFEVNDRAYIITNDESAVQTGASFAYLLVFILLQGVAGGSPGKLLLGLRVVKEDGSKAGIGRSFARTLLWIVDGAPWFAPLVGFIVGLTSTGHRRVGDLVAKTYVIASKDTGAPVRTSAVAAPTGQPAWGAAPPPPQWSSPATPPPQPAPEAPAPDAWTTTPTPPAPAPAPAPEASEMAGDYWSAGSRSTSEPSSTDEARSVAPDGSSEPPPLPTAPPEPAAWDPTAPTAEASTPLDGTPLEAPAPDSSTPSFESSTPADVPTPDVSHDPDWYRGPEAEPSTSAGPHDEPPSEGPSTKPIIEAPDTSEPETTAPTDPSTEWAPPTTPTSDISTGEDTSPTAGPAGFVAPGAAAPSQPPSAPTTPPTRSLPQFNQAAAPPPPQWDQARNTYIQWEPSQQAWLQWDAVANRWKPIDT